MVENHWFKDFTLVSHPYLWFRVIFGAILPCPTNKNQVVFIIFKTHQSIPKSTWSLVSSRKQHKCVLSCNSLPTIPVPFTPYTPFILHSSTVVVGQVPLRPDQVSPPPLFTQGHAAYRWWLQSTKCFMLVQSRGHLSHCSHNVSPRHPVSLFFVLSNPHILEVMLVKHNIQ